MPETFAVLSLKNRIHGVNTVRMRCTGIATCSKRLVVAVTLEYTTYAATMLLDAVVLILSFSIALYVYQRWQRHLHNPKALPTPPGPRPRFLTGNLYDVPRSKVGNEWASWRSLGRKLGTSHSRHHMCV